MDQPASRNMQHVMMHIRDFLTLNPVVPRNVVTAFFVGNLRRIVYINEDPKLPRPDVPGAIQFPFVVGDYPTTNLLALGRVNDQDLRHGSGAAREVKARELMRTRIPSRSVAPAISEAIAYLSVAVSIRAWIGSGVAVAIVIAVAIPGISVAIPVAVARALSKARNWHSQQGRQDHYAHLVHW